MPGAYAPGYARSPLSHPIVQFYAGTVTSAKFRTNGVSPAIRHRPEIRSLFTDSTAALSPAHITSNLGGCHEYGRYKYSRPGNMDATIVFESWITIQD